jgi:hypothetical protein|uniref:Bacteriophage T5 Orf172 DNA-binding domain-containing protein n=1 Tax=uncultured prokaryote TaxID=198431 RepID=A0A0H5QDG3_9ZZZZ|nr:hypothetical protein [uncultured prokaryote]
MIGIMRGKIISDIKRLAAEDGGKAPGQKTFEKLTGITTAQWRGKIWARWGDALEEAGLNRNALNASKDKDHVLDDYEAACLNFGRPPTYAELRLFGRQRPDFMGVNTYKNHFGSKDGVIAALRKRATLRGDDALLAILPTLDAPSPTDSASPLGLSEGIVYLLQSGNYFKIGRSDELEKRVKQISIALPDKVELVHAIRTDDPPGIESYWHRRFADCRANGEWFKLSPADLKAFKRRKFQ